MQSFFQKNKMIMRFFLLSLFSTCVLSAGCNPKNDNKIAVGKGSMPCITKDQQNHIHIVYGAGDSIMYTSSKEGKAYSHPELVAILPGVYDIATRGPQIAATANGIVITACDKTGNIYSYTKAAKEGWQQAKRVNDKNEISKEGLMSLSADGSFVYAIWLGVNNPKGQSVYGAGSADGGKTWSKNIIVYASPSGSVCECCKPSVVVKGTKVYVMFRNWLNGNRDLYLTESADGGKTFGEAKKSGSGSWKLNGCPMDGGGLVVNANKIPQAVWRRKDAIYTAEPGSQEKVIGTGRSCTIETINNKNIYAWTEKGDVVVMKGDGTKINLGKGNMPLLKAINNKKVICVWENENEIFTESLEL
jgi:hypothetical protein